MGSLTAEPQRERQCHLLFHIIASLLSTAKGHRHHLKYHLKSPFIYDTSQLPKVDKVNYFLLNSPVPLDSLFILETIILDIIIVLDSCRCLPEHRLFEDGVFIFAHPESGTVSETKSLTLIKNNYYIRVFCDPPLQKIHIKEILSGFLSLFFLRPYIL